MKVILPAKSTNIPMDVPNVPNGFGSGFWIHVIGYFIAGALYLMAFGNNRRKIVLIIFVALFLLGVLFEVAQLYVPHRTFNPIDILANGLGLAGVYLCYKVRREKT